MNAPIRMLPEDMQRANEYRFSRKHIDGYIAKELSQNQDIQDAIGYGVELVETWLQGQYYASKQARLEQLKDLDLREVVEKIFQGIAYIQREELFTSVSAQLAGQLQFSDRPEAIATMAELLAVLCETNAFDIFKRSEQASLVIQSRLPLSEEIRAYIDNATFLPPMVCVPNFVDHNRKSGYLTHNDSLVLGKGNHHEGDLCLDVINLQNQVAMKIDVGFMCAHEMQPSFELDSAEKAEQWHRFKKQTHELAILLINQGNRFYQTHKVDKRGRLYSVGYHISTQGSSFRKAMLELADEEIVEGV